MMRGRYELHKRAAAMAMALAFGLPIPAEITRRQSAAPSQPLRVIRTMPCDTNATANVALLAPQNTSFPSITPNTSTTRNMASAMKKSTFAMIRESCATLEKPKNPAISEITKKIMAHLITVTPLDRMRSVYERLILSQRVQPHNIAEVGSKF